MHGILSKPFHRNRRIAFAPFQKVVQEYVKQAVNSLKLTAVRLGRLTKSRIVSEILVGCDEYVPMPTDHIFAQVIRYTVITDIAAAMFYIVSRIVESLNGLSKHIKNGKQNPKR